MSGQFWSSPDLEPKRNFRFMLYIGDIVQYLVKTTDRPSFEITKAEHQYLNHTFKFPAKVTWNDLEVTLVDPVGDNSLEKMKQIIQASGYTWMDPDSDITSANWNTISKKRAIQASTAGQGKGYKLIQIDANGGVVDEWTLKNAWISKVAPGSLDYNSEDLSELALTITYDYANLRTTPR